MARQRGRETRERRKADERKHGKTEREREKSESGVSGRDRERTQD